jgi:hypothetical protein
VDSAAEIYFLMEVGLIHQHKTTDTIDESRKEDNSRQSASKANALHVTFNDILFAKLNQQKYGDYR